MSHFYGTLDGAPKLQKTARGHKSTGIKTQAASYAGAIRTQIGHDEANGRDWYVVTLIDWASKNTVKVIAEGFLDERS